MKVPSISLPQHTSHTSLVSTQKKKSGILSEQITCSIMYSFKEGQNNKNHAFPSKRCTSNGRTCYCYIFYNKNHTTNLYITCNKNIFFVKNYLSLLWVFTNFSILLVAAMITDDDDDDSDMMMAQSLWWGDKEGWSYRHCGTVLGYWPSDETWEGSSGSSFQKVENADQTKTMIARWHQVQMMFMVEGLR